MMKSLALALLALVPFAMGSPIQAEQVQSPNLAGRDLLDRTVTSVVCNINTPGYDESGLGSTYPDEIGYLNGLDGQLTLQSHESSRVSCEYNSGVWVVNNGNGPVDISWRWVAVMVQNILDGCFIQGSWVNGQASDSAGYVVIVAGTTC